MGTSRSSIHIQILKAFIYKTLGTSYLVFVYEYVFFSEYLSMNRNKKVEASFLGLEKNWGKKKSNGERGGRHGHCTPLLWDQGGEIGV